MSRVTITDLVAGDTAESADVNATLSSWNTALGTGAVGANNFRPEGLDRRSLSAATAAIYSAGKGSAPYTSEQVSSGAVSSGAFVVIGLNAGAVPMVVGPTAPASTTDTLLVTAAVQLDAANATQVFVRIERSPDNAVWTAVGQTCIFRTKASANTPRCIGYVLMHHVESSDATPYYYRLAYATSGGTTVEFNNGTIYVEDFAR